MSRSASKLRCGPLLSLGLVLGTWVVLRAALWEAPFSPATLAQVGEPDLAAVQPAVSAPGLVTAPEPMAPAAPDEWLPARLDQPLYQPVERPELAPLPARLPAAPRNLARGGLRGAELMIAHALLLSAGYQAEGEPRRDGTYRPGVGPVAPGVVYAPDAARRFDRETAEESGPKRWSFDLWALWREDTTTPLTSGRPSYGRSQVGAVLRYRLSPASGHAPELHLRATRALQGEQETDVAAGVSARPLPGVPVRLAAEARVSETDRGTELRGAAFAVTELPPVALPGGFTGEAYVQGGYVTGEFATAFVDGQARVTRELARTDTFRLTAGGGAWGGAQDNADRLDVGPSAGVSFDLGSTRGRVSADYRFRVAGQAEPASGPALTVTAGF